MGIFVLIVKLNYCYLFFYILFNYLIINNPLIILIDFTVVFIYLYFIYFDIFFNLIILFRYIKDKIRVIRFELIKSTWKVEVIPFNYTS